MQQSYKWVLVEGCVRGTKSDRKLFAHLRGLFVAKEDVGKLRSMFLSSDQPSNIIPDGDTNDTDYVFAGELGHRDNFARRLLKRNGQYRRHTEMVENNDVGFQVELPTIRFGWEEQHSKWNHFSGCYIPAPSLIQRFGLVCRNREVDFYDQEGQPATLYRQAGEGYLGDKHNLLYIRADLLRKYLEETRQVLVWCNWGERDWLRKIDGDDLIEATRKRALQSHSNIHRTFFEWSAEDCAVL